MEATFYNYYPQMGHKSFEELQTLLEAAKLIIPVGSKWRHYKGEESTILDITFDSDTEEVGVIYGEIKNLKNIHFSKSLNNFLEDVEWNGQKMPRFTRVTQAE